MIKQSFLNSLIGLKVTEAKQLCVDKGYQFKLVKEGKAITLISRPNTIIFWNVNGEVKFASIGDKKELEND